MKRTLGSSRKWSMIYIVNRGSSKQPFFYISWEHNPFIIVLLKMLFCNIALDFLYSRNDINPSTANFSASDFFLLVCSINPIFCWKKFFFLLWIACDTTSLSFMICCVKLDKFTCICCCVLWISIHCNYHGTPTAQKMKFSIKDLFSSLRIWSHLLKKSLMKNFVFCSVLRQELVKLDKVMVMGQNLFNNTFFTEHLQTDTKHTTLAEFTEHTTPAGSFIRRCFIKKVFLEILHNSQKNTCARVSFLLKPEAYNFIKKETLAQVFSC